METSVRHDGLKMQGSKNKVGGQKKNKVGGQKKTRWEVKKTRGGQKNKVGVKTKAGESKKQGGVKKTKWRIKMGQKNKVPRGKYKIIFS